MRILVTPIEYLRKQRARRKQLKRALHLLTVSGVLRSGQVEPRYFERPSQVNALYRQLSRRQAISPNQAMSSAATTTAGFEWLKLRGLVGTFNLSRFQIEQ